MQICLGAIGTEGDMTHLVQVRPGRVREHAAVSAGATAAGECATALGGTSSKRSVPALTWQLKRSVKRGSAIHKSTAV